MYGRGKVSEWLPAMGRYHSKRRVIAFAVALGLVPVMTILGYALVMSLHNARKDADPKERILGHWLERRRSSTQEYIFRKDGSFRHVLTGYEVVLNPLTNEPLTLPIRTGEHSYEASYQIEEPDIVMVVGEPALTERIKFAFDGDDLLLWTRLAETDVMPARFSRKGN